MNVLLAQFPGGHELLHAAREARPAGFVPVDAFTPLPIDGLTELIGVPSSFLRLYMFVGGAGTAALAYGLEWYSAVFAYPIDSGGRPLHSWPAFMMFPFAVGILAAALAGFAAFLAATGLPRLHHPLFAIEGFERVTQDAFVLAIDPPKADADLRLARAWLRDSGAVRIWEVTT
jgi:hypothetical protein